MSTRLMILETSRELKRELQVPVWRFLHVSIQEAVEGEGMTAPQEEQSRALGITTN